MTQGRDQAEGAETQKTCPTVGKLVLQRGTLWNEIERLKDKGNFLTEDQILQLLLGICRGLEAIHARGYAHRSVGGPSVLMGQKERASPKGLSGLCSPPKEQSP